MFFCVIANGQTSILKGEANSSKVGLSSDELTYACNEYEKLIETDAYLEYEKKVRFFADKMENAFNDKDLPIDSFKNDSLYLEWIGKNISKTKFKSIDEAKNALENQLKSEEKMKKENPKLFELIDKANLEQRHKIFQPLFNRARNEIQATKFIKLRLFITNCVNIK